ncbi:MAG: acyltransferase domain-containing protein, partial [bacterium]
MGAELYSCERVFRAEVDRCAELLQPVLATDLRSIVFPSLGSEEEAERLLVETRYTQPALFMIEYALAKLWMSWGIQPTAMIGHSVGEYVAGCLSGVFTLEDALMLVARRGALVQEQPNGAMVAVRLPEKELASRLNGGLSIAAINSPGLCVVAGPYDLVGALEEQLRGEGVMVRRLQTSHAFHSAMMEPVLAPFAELLRRVNLRGPKIPYISNVTARWITESEAKTPAYWAGHVRETVRFADGIAEFMKDPKNLLLEVGPGQTLSQAARQHPERLPEQTVLSSLPVAGVEELRGILETLGRLWMTGVSLDWQAFYANERRKRTVLPGYPFERRRYWPASIPTVRALPTSAPPAGPPQPTTSIEVQAAQ